MNDIIENKNVVGKTILSEDNGKGTVIAYDFEVNAYVIHRLDGRGWTPSQRVKQLILEQSDANRSLSLYNNCWYVTPDRVVGIVTPLAEFQRKHVPATTPAKPLEPTAPMTAQVLQMLRKKGDVTSIEAQGVLRCRSLSKRISELRRLGHRITRTLQEDHTGQRYARYILAS